ncbi:hypothetical protein GOICGAJE_01509 [Bacillus sp. MB95]|nr:hypothetical protein [Bacillus sp. MB95]
MNAGEDLYIHATALVKAVQQGHFKMVKLLAESGANIAAWYTLGEGQETTTINAVKMAQMKGHNEILAYLYSKSENEMNTLESENNNSIFNYVENKAVEKGSDYIVKQLKRSDQAPYFENINRSSVC